MFLTRPHNLLTRFQPILVFINLVCKSKFVSFLSPLFHWVFEPYTYRGVLLSTFLQAILTPSLHLLNVLLQIANKLGLIKKQPWSGVVAGGTATDYEFERRRFGRLRSVLSSPCRPALLWGIPSLLSNT
jgi:hypothetical protein